MLSIFSERRNLLRIAPYVLIAVTFIAYAAVSTLGFVYDDEAQIVHDLFVQQWRFVPAYFTSHVWQWLFPHVPGNYYRPLFLIWLLLNFKLVGLSTTGWHLLTLALHLVVTWQVYRLAVRLSGDEGWALVAALLFGVHPVHIEAVAWVSGATEPLAAICILGSLLSYIRFRSQQGRIYYWLTLAWFALGLLTKETAILVPGLLVGYDLVVHVEELGPAERFVESLRRIAPMAAIISTYLVARQHALGALSHRMADVSLAENLYTIPSLLVFYARLLLYPVGLSAFYDTPYVTSARAALPATLIVLSGALIAGYWIWRTRSRVLAFAAIFLILPLLPLMKLDVFVRGEIAHDRYLYLPSVGFVLLVALAFRKLASAADLRVVTYAALAVLTVFYMGATLVQSLYWHDNLVLYARGVTIAPNNPIARNDLANELLKRGDKTRAIEQYRAVLQAQPNFWLARYNIGYAEYSTGDCVGAIRDLGLAARLNPTDAETFFYRGQCLVKLGDRSDGVSSMRRGIELEPRMPNFRAILADTLAQSGSPDDLQDALKLYMEEATANPAHPYAAASAAKLEDRISQETTR